MPLFDFNRRIIGALVVLAITQLIGWGTIGLLSVVGRQVATDLGMDLATAFTGSTVLYITMGLCGPPLARAFTRFGARGVMMAGSIVCAPGFLLLAVAHEPLAYFAGWFCLGAGGSATLSTAAYIALSEVAGPKARTAIGALMLVTGLSSSLFWPTTSLLAGVIGWRGTCLVYAALMIAVCLPLYAIGLPRRPARHEAAPAGELATPAMPAAPPTTFLLMVIAIALTTFVSFGFSAVLIELLKSKGLSATQAVAFGASLGVFQVSARVVDFAGGARWDGIATGLVAGLVLPVAILLLMFGEGALWAIAGFIMIYGLGSGTLAVSRATIPLVFYDKADFVRATSRIALPLNLTAAAAPPILAAILTTFGANAVLGAGLACSCGAVAILAVLSRRRPAVNAAARSDAP